VAHRPAVPPRPIRAGRCSTVDVMFFEAEDRTSDSPYVARVWRCRSDEVAQMTSAADPHLKMVIWEHRGRIHVAVRGAESKATPCPVPLDAWFLGINFAVGTTMPHLPPTRLVDDWIEIPDATRRSFRLAGSSWHLPTYENAEEFVRRLVSTGTLVRDPLVADLALGRSSDLSARTVQRRFRAVTGLTRGAVRQITRATHAGVLIQEGVAPLEVVHRLRYFDQPHLTRSLVRFVGRTTVQLTNPDPAAPLSLLYKT
jgi:AraC-like DNA-binding protein